MGDAVVVSVGIAVLALVVGCGSGGSGAAGADAARADAAIDVGAGLHEAGDDAHDSSPGAPADSGSSLEASSAEDGGACVALGFSCGAGATCCDGTCESGSNCCHAAGGSCDPTALNPDAYCCGGGTCSAAGTCVALTCYSTSGDCEYAGALPCCDHRLACTPAAGDSGLLPPMCCAASGTTLDAGESDLCCSAGIIENSNGTITCATPSM